MADYWRDRDGRDRYSPTDKDLESLVGFLCWDFDLVPPLGVLADAAAEELFLLGKEQYAVLDSLEQFARPRMVVQGGAGTGKTLLAVEAAKREARKANGDVVFVCYNWQLASFLDTKFRAEHHQGSRIVAKSIFSLLNELIESSSLADEFRRKCEATTNHQSPTLRARNSCSIPNHLGCFDETPTAANDGDAGRFRRPRLKSLSTRELPPILGEGMPIPELNSNGLLPPGIHECTLEEVGDRFGRFQKTSQRCGLFANLEKYVQDVVATGRVEELVIDGSFVTARHDPNDIDLIVVLAADHDLTADLRPFEYNVVSKKRVRKAYKFDVLVALSGSDLYQGYLRFFQQVRNAPTQRKGILRVKL